MAFSFLFLLRGGISECAHSNEIDPFASTKETITATLLEI
jgi:hypothetical protein